MDELLTYAARMEQAQEAIKEFRAALRAGNRAEAVVAYGRLMDQIGPILARKARSMAGAAPAAEALEDLRDQLQQDLFSPTYESMERYLGAYMRDLANRVRRRYPEKYIAKRASISIEATGENSPERGADTTREWEDSASQTMWETLGNQIDLQRALARLPAVEREVVKRRMEGWSNDDIANALGVSPATATRRHKSAMGALRALLGDGV